MLGCAFILLEPPGAADSYRASVNVTLEEGPDLDLDDLIQAQVEASERVLTDLELVAVEVDETQDRPARRVEAIYRDGAHHVVFEQRMIQLPDRVLAFSATCSSDTHGGTSAVLAGLVQTLSVTAQAGSNSRAQKC